MKRFLCLYITLTLLGISCQEATRMPLLRIETTEHLDFESKKRIALTQVSDSDTLVLNGTAKWRGGWSRQFEKKSFSLDTEFPIALADMNPHTKWILNASYIDKTLMRHRFWYELWQAMDPNHVAASSRYVNLEVNGKDQGVYIAMERIHESRLGIEPTGVLFKDPQVFRRDSIPAEKSESYFHQKFPDPEIENRDRILFEFRSFLLESDSLTFSNNITEWVDLNNIIDWHLLLLLSHNGDGVLKNFYLYKRSEKDLIKVIPWDYDHSAGRDGDNELNMRNTFIDDHRNVLLDRLVQSNAQNYNQLRCERWWELRNTERFTMKNIGQRIQYLKEILHPEIERNFNIWPYNGPGFYDDQNHNQEVELILNYLTERIDFLDKYFDCQTK